MRIILHRHPYVCEIQRSRILAWLIANRDLHTLSHKLTKCVPYEIRPCVFDILITCFNLRCKLTRKCNLICWFNLALAFMTFDQLKYSSVLSRYVLIVHSILCLQRVGMSICSHLLSTKVRNLQVAIVC